MIHWWSLENSNMLQYCTKRICGSNPNAVHFLFTYINAHNVSFLFSQVFPWSSFIYNTSWAKWLFYWQLQHTFHGFIQCLVKVCYHTSPWSLLTLARGLFKKHLYAIVLEITIIFNMKALIVQKKVKDLGALPMTIEVTFIIFVTTSPSTLYVIDFS